MDEWCKQNQRRLDLLQRILDKVVLAGPAMDAQKRLAVWSLEIRATIQSGKLGVAAAQLQAIQPDMSIVLASPDAATLPVAARAWPNEVLFARELNKHDQFDASDIEPSDVQQGRKATASSWQRWPTSPSCTRT